jgi:NADH dehydrogenase
MRGEPLVPFRYRDRGMFAVIGRGAAVGILFERIKMSGFAAWIAWLTIHIWFLIGFRNRIAVLFNWAWSFLTLRRNAQLITGEDIKLLPRMAASPPRGEAALGVAQDGQGAAGSDSAAPHRS